VSTVDVERNQEYNATEDLDRLVGEMQEVEWAGKLRREALAYFSKKGWPTREEEEWRRTDVSSYDFSDYSLTCAPEEGAPPAVEVPEESAGVVRFESGRCVGLGLSEELSGRGVYFGSLQHLLGTGRSAPEAERVHQKVEKAWRAGFARADNRFQAWNLAGFTHGVVLHIPSGVRIEEPIYIDFYESGDQRVSIPRVAMILEQGAEATVVQAIRGAEEGEVIYNESVDIHVGQNAHLRYLTMQNLNLDASFFGFGSGSIAKDGSLQHYICSFGGMLAKNRFDCTLDGEGSLVRLNGLYFPYEDQHMDLRTVQHHRAPHAESRTYYKGAQRDEAHSVYQGLIEVAHEAVQTDAFLENKNIILNDGARADSIPTLNIETDDVQCSHGSSTGKIDRTQLFYLKARGYPPAEAEEMLLQGFFEDIIHHAPERLQDELRGLIRARVLAAYESDDDSEDE